MKVIILRGIPASGKSTYAKKYLKENPDTVRLNMDSLRLMYRSEAFSNKFERLVKHSEIELIKIALNKKLDIIIDDTNLSIKRIKHLFKIIESFNPVIEVITFDTEYEICKYRNSHRKEYVPEIAMETMNDLYQLHFKAVNDYLLTAKISKNDIQIFKNLKMI